MTDAQAPSAARDGQPLSQPDFRRLQRSVAVGVRRQGGHPREARRLWISDLPELRGRRGGGGGAHELRQLEEVRRGGGKVASVHQSCAAVSPSDAGARWVNPDRTHSVGKN